MKSKADEARRKAEHAEKHRREEAEADRRREHHRHQAEAYTLLAEMESGFTLPADLSRNDPHFKAKAAQAFHAFGERRERLRELIRQGYLGDEPRAQDTSPAEADARKKMDKPSRWSLAAGRLAELKAVDRGEVEAEITRLTARAEELAKLYEAPDNTQAIAALVPERQAAEARKDKNAVNRIQKQIHELRFNQTGILVAEYEAATNEKERRRIEQKIEKTIAEQEAVAKRLNKAKALLDATAPANLRKLAAVAKADREKPREPRQDELRERAQRILEGKTVSPFLRSEAEAERVRGYVLAIAHDRLKKMIDVFREAKRRAVSVLNKRRKAESESLHKTLLTYYAEIHVADPYATEGAKVEATLEKHRVACAAQGKRDEIRTSPATFYRAKKEHADYLQACIDAENRKHEGSWE